MELPHLPPINDEQPLGCCFGCGDLNPIGLHLKPVYDGERVSANYVPEANHQGWHNVTHGGLLYTVLDEVTAYAVLCAGYNYGVTAKSAVRFRKPAATHEPLLATAWPTRTTSRFVEVYGQLATKDGTIVADVDSTFIPAGRCTRAFLWDMDGVIIDSAAPHFQSWKEAFAARGASYTEAQFKSLFGSRDDLIIRKVLGEMPDGEIHAIAEEKERRYREMCLDGVRVFPGVLSLLEAMKKGGFRVALGTSAPMANVDAISAATGIDRYLNAVVCGEDVREGKPSPEIYLQAAERIGADPAHCVVFEDAPLGIEAARRAGMKCVAVCNSHPRDALKAADFVVDSIEELDLIQLIRWI